MNDFVKFLNQFRCDKGIITHTSMKGGKYHIPEASLDIFYEQYEKAMVKGTDLHLTEKPLNPSRLRVDLDFRFAMPQGCGRGASGMPPVEGATSTTTRLPRLYQHPHLVRIVEAYSRILAEYLQGDAQTWVAYVMEKPHPTETRGKIKDGIHIVWPNAVVSHSFMHLVRKHILEQAADIFEGLSLCNTFDDVIDQAIIDKNNWQMYGSRKLDSDAYRVTHVFQYDPESGEVRELPAPSALDEIKFVRLFAMRDPRVAPTPILEAKEEEIDQYIRHVLPTIDERRKSKLHDQIFNKSINLTKTYVSEDELVLVRQLVRECLKSQRAENYEDWIKLGWTLRNIDYRLLDTWIEFSKVSSKYVEGECQKLWNNMRIDTMGIGTIRWWARDDNPVKYGEILNQSVTHLVDRCIGSDGAHYNVAEVVHAMYKDRYRFTSRDLWYMYCDEKHRWVRTREGLQLRLVLSNEVCMKFMERSIYWTQEASRVTDTQHELYQDKAKKLNKISIQLRNAGYKDSVMKECKSLFTDENFEQVLDSHPHLLGFENGVYDLRMHEFREGLPDDYISFTTGRNYMEYDALSVESREIRTYLSQVFTQENVRKYMLDWLAAVVDGGVRQEKFYIFTGSGCHAKDTPIMMADGKCKMVQDVQPGDQLMGDDSTPRNVLQLFRGTDDMYRIQPAKGDPFVVNASHKLSLKVSASSCPRITTSPGKFRVKYLLHTFHTPEDGSLVRQCEKHFNTIEDAQHCLEQLQQQKDVLQMGDVVDVQVKNYLHFNMKNYHMYLFKTGLSFEEQPVKMDPYMLGVWLGDGSSRTIQITTMDEEIVQYFRDHMPPNHDFHKLTSNGQGKASNYSITFTGKRERYARQNDFLRALHEYNLILNKHVPDDYKYNSREVRLKILAGLLDTDATYHTEMRQYTISQKSEKLADDIVHLARSLGFACYKKQVTAMCCNNGKVGTYYRMNICGKGLQEIPCLLPRKKAQPRRKVKDVLLNKFEVEYVGQGDYYGVEVDQNHRYVMGDFTVTANSNSKSLYLNLVQKAIGEYYCILPIALLTQKRTASNSAQSELERTKGRRAAVMQEPGESEKLNIGLMKELSGGDRIQVRGLYKEPVEFKPQFKMVMTCNDLPEVPSDDNGTWRRLRVIQFTSRFCDKPDPHKPNEFPLDPELTDKIERWADTFIAMILDHHRNINPKLIHEPSEITIATNLYRQNNDIIGQFIDEHFVVDETSTERVPLAKTFVAFKGWASQVAQKGKKIPDRNQFRDYMASRFGTYPSDGRGWRGIRSLHKGEDADSDIE